MAASSGEYRGTEPRLTARRAQRSTAAVFARAGLSAGGGQVYLVTYDNQLYALGIPMKYPHGPGEIGTRGRLRRGK